MRLVVVMELFAALELGTVFSLWPITWRIKLFMGEPGESLLFKLQRHFFSIIKINRLTHSNRNHGRRGN